MQNLTASLIAAYCFATAAKTARAQEPVPAAAEPEASAAAPSVPPNEPEGPTASGDLAAVVVTGTRRTARSLGRAVTYDAEVTRIRRTSRGARVEWRATRHGKVTSAEADYVLVTLQPGLLTDLDNDFSPRVRQALAAPDSSPLAKVGFRATRRVWELDEQIYGGISWTDHSITQIWYPSHGLHAQKGILLGAYLFRDGEDFAKLSPAARVELALEGGELLHPQYRKHLERGVAISWRKVKYSRGATTHWSGEARRTEYPILLEPDGPYFFAGEYSSYINGWQEGALRSAQHAITRLAVVNIQKHPIRAKEQNP